LPDMPNLFAFQEGSKKGVSASRDRKRQSRFAFLFSAIVRTLGNQPPSDGEPGRIIGFDTIRPSGTEIA
jgi:hypothetical protein